MLCHSTSRTAILALGAVPVAVHQTGVRRSCDDRVLASRVAILALGALHAVLRASIHRRCDDVLLHCVLRSICKLALSIKQAVTPGLRFWHGHQRLHNESQGAEGQRRERSVCSSVTTRIRP